MAGGYTQDLEPPSAEEAALIDTYIPNLTDPAHFHALPATDALENLLGRHVAPTHRPRRDLSGEPHNRSAKEMIEAQSWRALAVWARDAIVAVDPSRTALLLQLWYLRLYALHALRLVSLHLRELDSLFDTIYQSLPPSSILPLPSSRSSASSHSIPIHPAIPFPLLVMRARAVGAEGIVGGRRRRRMAPGVVEDEARLREMDAVRDLLDASRRMAVRESKLNRPLRAKLWRHRTHRLTLLLASLLTGLNPPFPSSDPSAPSSLPPSDPRAALDLLESLSGAFAQEEGEGKEREEALVARVKLGATVGDAEAMNTALQELEASTVDAGNEEGEKVLREAKGIRAVAMGKWNVATDSWASGNEIVDKNNTAVAALYTGSNALPLMENLMRSETASLAATSEPLIFNLATLLELRSDRTLAAKREALVRAAKVGVGSQGLTGACFKLE